MNYGVVAEFNPFHNGHKKFVDSLKSDGESTVTAVMSESFVQRGECAFLDAYSRVKAALSCGVDLVISLPVAYAVSSAERFAFGGVSLLDSLGVLDSIAFGSECADAALLKSVAEKITSEEFSGALENYLSTGVSFPTARQRALAKLYGEEFANVLSSPNDILGVEYIKALNKIGSKLSVRAVKRVGASHDGDEICDNIASASLLRSLSVEDIECFVPEQSYNIIKEAFDNNKAPAEMKNIESAVLARLRRMTVEDFRALPDVTEGLEFRIYEAVRSSKSVEKILDNVKTKRYTHSRLRRILLCAFLEITKQAAEVKPQYIRVLGFNENGARLLKVAKEKSSLPIVTRFSEIKQLGETAQGEFLQEAVSRDLFALAMPTPDICGREMTDKLIVIKD